MNDGVIRKRKLCNWKNNNYAHKEHKFTNIHAIETFITYTHTYIHKHLIFLYILKKIFHSRQQKSNNFLFHKEIPFIE